MIFYCDCSKSQLLQEDKAIASIGSMYLTDEGLDWGEIYPSESRRILLEENPNDVRNDFIQPDYDEIGVTIKTSNDSEHEFPIRF